MIEALVEECFAALNQSTPIRKRAYAMHVLTIFLKRAYLSGIQEEVRRAAIERSLKPVKHSAHFGAYWPFDSSSFVAIPAEE